MTKATPSGCRSSTPVARGHHDRHHGAVSRTTSLQTPCWPTVMPSTPCSGSSTAATHRPPAATPQWFSRPRDDPGQDPVAGVVRRMPHDPAVPLLVAERGHTEIQNHARSSPLQKPAHRSGPGQQPVLVYVFRNHGDHAGVHEPRISVQVDAPEGAARPRQRPRQGAAVQGNDPARLIGFERGRVRVQRVRARVHLQVTPVVKTRLELAVMHFEEVDHFHARDVDASHRPHGAFRRSRPPAAAPRGTASPARSTRARAVGERQARRIAQDQPQQVRGGGRLQARLVGQIRGKPAGNGCVPLQNDGRMLRRALDTVDGAQGEWRQHRKAGYHGAVRLCIGAGHGWC